MSPENAQKLDAAIEHLKTKQQLRALPPLQKHGRHLTYEGKSLLNVSSNDYLGLGTDSDLQAAFFEQIHAPSSTAHAWLGATSSRLLTGNDEQLDQLECELADWYHIATRADAPSKKTALIFNSGYHANLGILPALTALPVKTLIVADKLVHASMIDGIQLSLSKHCQYRRYRHNDYAHLQALIDKADDDITRIIIVTESIFSMDGDRADLQRLVQMKAQDPRIELYVDEAHAVGVLGTTGLGLAEETQTLNDIDYLVGTFGKAFASVGAYILCDAPVKQWLINQMRPLIFSTALPPINHAWTRFVLAKMPHLTHARTHVAQLSLTLRQAIASKNEKQADPSRLHYESPIVPYILGDNGRAVAKAQALQAAGFFARAIRPPTVPVNTARIRLVMSAALSDTDIARLIACL